MGYSWLLLESSLHNYYLQQQTNRMCFTSESLEEKDQSLQTKLSELVNSLERKRIAIVLSTGAAFVTFTIAILLSLSTIAKDSLLKSTDTFSVYGLLYGTLLYTVIGITMVLLALALPGKPPTLEKWLGKLWGYQINLKCTVDFLTNSVFPRSEYGKALRAF